MRAVVAPAPAAARSGGAVHRNRSLARRRSALPAASRRTGLACRAAESGAELASQPEDARGAIALGLRSFEAGDYDGALALFGQALSLPGRGIKRFRDKPPAISDGERAAAYFNIACCYAKLGQVQDGLVAVAGVLEAGYTDFAQLRSDPDLAALRADPKFEGLLARFEKKGGALGGFLGGFL